MKTEKAKVSKVTLKIPRPLYDKVVELIEGRGYNSVTDFVVYVLRDLVASHNVALREGRADRGESYGQQQNQLAQVKARLRALGDLADGPIEPED